MKIDENSLDPFQKEFFAKLDAFVAAQGTAEKAAESLGISVGVLNGYVYRYRAPKYSTVAKLTDIMDRTTGTDLASGINKDDFILVPKVEAKAGAGASLLTSDNTEGWYAFRRAFVSRTHISEQHSVLMDVIGDSMQPLIQDGDTILIDQTDKDIQEGKIYVVTLGEELRVKRIFLGINGLILRSENSIYPDIVVTAADMDSLVIQGRVRWFGRVI